MTYTLSKLLPQHLPLMLIGQGKQIVYVLQVLATLVPPGLAEAATDAVDDAHGVGVAVHDGVGGDAEEGAC